jgi:hypothetical protein
MTAREHAVRALWTLFEPIHAVSYFAQEARDEFAAIGLTRYWDGYFAGRAAPLGTVPAAPVVAIFNGFSPSLVGRALPAVWSVTTGVGCALPRRRSRPPLGRRRRNARR